MVTATRRAEALSKVPISATALTQDDMDLKGIKDFQDLVRFTPGVSIDTSGTNAISIRGISSSAAAGTTGIYLDDTWASSSCSAGPAIRPSAVSAVWRIRRPTAPGTR